MAVDTIHIETELLQGLGDGEADLRIADMRLYLGLCAKAFASASAQSLVYLPQRDAFRALCHIPGTGQAGDAELRMRLDRLMAFGLLEHPVSEDTFSAAAHGADGERGMSLDDHKTVETWKIRAGDPWLFQILSVDGSPHRCTSHGSGKYVMLRRSLFKGPAESCDFAQLTDAELIAFLLMLTGTRFMPFGGVDQGYVHRDGGHTKLGKIVEQAYLAAFGAKAPKGQSLPEVLDELVEKQFLTWARLPMVKMDQHGNETVLCPSWFQYPSGRSQDSEPAEPKMTDVLIPLKGYGCKEDVASFVRMLREGELDGVADPTGLGGKLVPLCPTGDWEERLESRGSSARATSVW